MSGVVTQADETARHLIDKIIAAYHTTRLSEVGAIDHVLSKPYVREALARHREQSELSAYRRGVEDAARAFKSAQYSPAPYTDGMKVIRKLSEGQG